MVFAGRADRLDAAARAAFAAELPQAELVSARDPADAARLHERIVLTIHESCRVLAEVHEETGTRLRGAPRPGWSRRGRARPG